MSAHIRIARLLCISAALAASQGLAQSAQPVQPTQPFGGNGLNVPRAGQGAGNPVNPGQKAPTLTLSAGEGDKRINEWKVYGRYQFTETWGAELNYSGWGKRAGPGAGAGAAPGAAALPGASDAVPRGSQINLAATGTLPVTQGLSLYGKLGYGRNEVTGSPYCLSAACGPLAGGRSEGARAGVGLRYSFSDNWGLRVDYENVNSLSAPNAVPAKGDSWSARIKYTF